MFRSSSNSYFFSAAFWYDVEAERAGAGDKPDVAGDSRIAVRTGAAVCVRISRGIVADYRTGAVLLNKIS